MSSSGSPPPNPPHHRTGPMSSPVPPVELLEASRPSTSSEHYDGLTFVSHMIAGATAGTVEHIAMYPVDTIKTRMQALAHPGQRLHRSSVLTALRTAVRREGLPKLYQGVGAVAAGAGPAHALQFAVYEHAKQALGGNESGHHMVATAAAGALATVVNDGVMTPADVIKQRLQVAHSPYTGVLDCINKVRRPTHSPPVSHVAACTAASSRGRACGRSSQQRRASTGALCVHLCPCGRMAIAVHQQSATQGEAPLGGDGVRINWAPTAQRALQPDPSASPLVAAAAAARRCPLPLRSGAPRASEPSTARTAPRLS